VLLDQVLGLPAGTVDCLIEMLGIALLQRGDDVSDVDASAQHVVRMTGAGLDPGHDPPLLAPRFGCIARLGKATQNLGLVQSAAHPDIIGNRLDQRVEHDIAGQTENVVDTVVFAPRHRLVSAVVSVTANADAGVGPVPADAPDQATEELANLHTRGRLARPQDYNDRRTGRRIVDMDRQKTALIIVGVPMRQLLVAVHNVDRVIDIQHHRPRRPRVAPTPDVDECVSEAEDLAQRRCILPA
jgi:hypothetical protein